MRLGCICVLLLIARPLWAQSLVTAPARIAALSAYFDSQLPEGNLRCHVRLTQSDQSSFGIRVNYRVEIPAGEYPDRSRHQWATAVRVAPENSPAEPVDLADASQAVVLVRRGWVIHRSGSFLGGPGMAWRISDETGLVCRQELRLKGSSDMSLALEPGAIQDSSLAGLEQPLRHDPRTKLDRLTILLDPCQQLPRFFYVRPERQGPIPNPAIWEGSIAWSMHLVHGKTLGFYGDGDLAKAIEQIRRAVLPPSD